MKKLARTHDRDQSPWWFSLNGDWDFQLFARPELVPDQYTQSHYHDDNWQHITVPGCWTCQDVGDSPKYTNIKMPDGFADLEPPLVPENNPTGVYRRSFDLPHDWDQQRIVLHIGGAESCCTVYLNGHFIGMAKDSRLPSEFEVTDQTQSW